MHIFQTIGISFVQVLIFSWIMLIVLIVPTPMAMLYQRQFSVPSLRGRLMSTSGSCGVNGHTTRCTGPVSVVLQLRLVSGWGLTNWRSVLPCGPMRLWKDLAFY